MAADDMLIRPAEEADAELLTVERGHARLEWCALNWSEPALRLEGERLRRLGSARA